MFRPRRAVVTGLLALTACHGTVPSDLAPGAQRSSLAAVWDGAAAQGTWVMTGASFESYVAIGTFPADVPGRIYLCEIGDQGTFLFKGEIGADGILSWDPWHGFPDEQAQQSGGSLSLVNQNGDTLGDYVRGEWPMGACGYGLREGALVHSAARAFVYTDNATLGVSIHEVTFDGIPIARNERLDQACLLRTIVPPAPFSGSYQVAIRYWEDTDNDQGLEEHTTFTSVPASWFAEGQCTVLELHPCSDGYCLQVRS